MHTGNGNTSGKRDGVIFTSASTSNPSLRSSFVSPPSPTFVPLAKTFSNESTSSTSDDHSAHIWRSASTQQRKLSRKLPPHLTESLEMLASIEPTIPETAQHDLFPTMYTLDVTAPTVTTVPEHSVALLPAVGPKSNARKLVNKGSISRPTPSIASSIPRLSVSSSMTDADTLPPLTPKSSHPSLRPTSRQPLFVSTLFKPTGTTSSSASSSSLPTSRGSDEHARTSEDVPALSCGSNSATESSCGTWSSFDIEYHPSGSKRNLGRKEKKEIKRAEKARFDESTPPTTKELYEASLMDVIDEKGMRVRFGDLVRGKKTIVVFIRHWFCPLCAQYIKSVIRDVSPDALEDAGVELIIIGNGSSKMINGYANKYFNSPFKTYTDPTLSLYRVLGLTRQTSDSGPDSERGDYLTETALETTVNTLKRAAKMPLRNPGHFTQLGGEFVFDGTLNVVYTHRMINTRDHAPIRDVCREAGVRLEFIHYEPGPAPPMVHLQSTEMLGQFSGVVDGEALDDWVGEREKTLERIKEMKAQRRKGTLESRADKVRVVLSDDEGVEEFGQLSLERQTSVY